MIQNIRIDIVAYLYEGYESFLDSFYEKVKQAIKQSKYYKTFLDIEKLSDGIHFTSEIQNEIEWETDDEFNHHGYGHYNGVLRKDEFKYSLNKFLKGLDSDGCFCELEDNSDFGDSDIW